MNHHHRKILHQIFQHPVNANMSFRDIESVLGELGAGIENRQGSRIAVTLNGNTVVIHHGGHDVHKDEVVQVRKFIETCGIEPARDYPL
ncbi:MAG: hypothetical protein ACMVY4_05430 [Minwuia sp.]|uniref:hypothetical protein n=1 Tax=Minwuia sp. TaxID=2493630 RepID=UPI003A865848